MTTTFNAVLKSSALGQDRLGLSGRGGSAGGVPCGPKMSPKRLSWESLTPELSGGSAWHTWAAVRFFNTTGPIRPERHYCIPPLDRVDLDEILTLIWQERYFVLHAPRQTGKTSTLLALADRLNSAGE